MKIESTYGTINAPGTTDGVLIVEPPEVSDPEFIYDGQRGFDPLGGTRPPTQAGGRHGTIKVIAEGIGGAAAYSATVFPSIHQLLLISGLGATNVTTGGAEKWYYNPVVAPTVLNSATIDVHLAGQLSRFYGCYSDFEVEVTGPSIPHWTFNVAGIVDYVVDASIPSYSNYPSASNQPPTAVNCAVTLGSWTAATVRSFHFKGGRQHTAGARPNLSIASPSHSGFTPGNHDPMITIVVEASALATVTPWNTGTTLNPFRAMEDHNLMNFSLTVGSAQYKKWNIWSGANTGVAAQAYIRSIKETKDGPTRLWEMEIGFAPSTYTALDHYTIMWN